MLGGGGQLGDALAGGPGGPALPLGGVGAAGVGAIGVGERGLDALHEPGGQLGGALGGPDGELAGVCGFCCGCHSICSIHLYYQALEKREEGTVRLRSFQVKKFRNIVDSGEVTVEKQVTCLVGKNEAGKSALLEALYLFNPAYG
ncbi:MAG: AAA family ATPase [Chloroflexi bacterium]|nr:AAA family ATPase [Chloroflexota bacterium]